MQPLRSATTIVLDEVEVEHTSLKQLMTEIPKIMPTDRRYDPKVTVLAEYVD